MKVIIGGNEYTLKASVYDIDKIIRKVPEEGFKNMLMIDFRDYVCKTAHGLLTREPHHLFKPFLTPRALKKCITMEEIKKLQESIILLINGTDSESGNALPSGD